MLVSIEKIKHHLNLDMDYIDDDSYLEMLELAAEELVLKHIDMTFDEIAMNEGEIPQSLLHAILLFVGNMYDNRESVAYTSITEVPMSLKYILDMYRNYTDSNI